VKPARALQPRTRIAILYAAFQRRERTMTQTSNRIFDEMARLMNDAAGVASGVRREFDVFFKHQADRVLRDLDIIKREEFEAVKDMARIAREENEALKARIASLEAKLGVAQAEMPSPPTGEPPSVPPEKAAPNVRPNTPFEE
jgi:BMFP domain-containing protein YqiC